jgi:predicted cupin superfamily sugar epimerase
MATRPVPAVAAQLGMEPHPEGGWFVRTWAAGPRVETPGGTRPAATLIHFLLPAGEVSAWHAVVSDEIWLWHGPGTLSLQLGGTGAEPDAAGPVRLLGPGGTDHDAAFQVLVPANTWQRTLPGTTEVLVSCLVSPGFDFADWKLFTG